MFNTRFFLVFLLLNSAFLLSAISPSKQNESGKVTVDLSEYEYKVYSQSGEDGVILAILNFIGPTKKYYVEFGASDALECNTRLLREKYGWNGLLMDGFHYKPEINLQRSFITAENINSLFEKYEVPCDLDLLSIDIDYNDFYVWHSIDPKYSPKIVVIEFNPTHLPGEDKVVIYAPNRGWDGTNYYGASISALARLGDLKGYTLVYVHKDAVNLFFIRKDILESIPYFFKDAGDVFKLYRYPKYAINGPNGGHQADSLNRPYISSFDVIPMHNKVN